MVEFALVTSLIVVPLIFGVIEVGRLVWSKDMITAAAREGVRYAAVHGTDCSLAGGCTLADSAAVANAVIARTKLSPIVVRTTWAQDKDPGDTVTVSVTYIFNPVVRLPFLNSSKNITATSKRVVAY